MFAIVAENLISLIYFNFLYVVPYWKILQQYDDITNNNIIIGLD